MLLNAEPLTSTVMKLRFTILFLVACPFFSAMAQNKCKPRVEFAVNQTSANSYSITLRSETPLGNPMLKLYDLYTGKVVAEKRVNNSLTSKQEVFTNVKPSRYVVYVSHDGCERQVGIGGIEGIKVGTL